MSISKKKIAKVILLPGFMPRLNELFGSGFSYFSILVAQVYGMVRILPKTHPFLQAAPPEFNTRDVIREAANNLKFTKNNIDQIVIFFAIIAAIFIFMAQIALFVFAFFISTANAQTIPTTIEGFFKTNNPEEDLAFRMLDLVFGHPDFFGSKEALNSTSIHAGLQSLLELYSFGMIIVGAMIIIYFVVVVVNETAQTGVPFGKRFTHAWAPIRLVVFFGLLIPISNGFNGGQYITLTMAKLGSGLATTGWTLFNDTIAASAGDETLLGKKEHNVAIPKAVDLLELAEFIMIVNTCKLGYQKIYNDEEFKSIPDWKNGVRPWAILRDKEKGGTSGFFAEPLEGQSFQDLADQTNGNTIHIIFGVQDEKHYPSARAHVENVCGSIAMEISDLSEPGSAIIQNGYLDLVKELLNDADLLKYAESYNLRSIPIDSAPDSELPKQAYKETVQTFLREKMDGEKGLIAQAVKAQRESGEWEVPEEMRDYGWAGAAIWYNKIAAQNGALITAIHYPPKPVNMPRVMEQVYKAKQNEDHNPDPKMAYSPFFSSGASPINYAIHGEEYIAFSLSSVYQYWREDNNVQLKLTGNMFIDTINAVLGTEGLFEICENTDIHPLAQLSMVGKSLVESSIRSFAISTGATIFAIIPTSFSAASSAFAGFFGTVAGMGLLIGFILFYIVPFLPFIYFFFAVGSWVKTIFEAIIAMPLWALAHLRIDGDGLAGDAALGGYFLLFEIFIRPLLIVFGLLAAISIFAAMVKVLNDVFYLVVSSVSGSDLESATLCKTVTTRAEKPELADAYRGTVDQFFFTVLYTIFVYMIGNSAFKLIDNIPKQILRWIGDTTGSFLDNAGDAAEGLLKYAALGGSQFGGSISKGFEGLGKGAQESAGQIFGGK